MIKRKLAAGLMTGAVLGSVVALGPVAVASAEPVNPVTRIADRTNPAVQIVETDYRAKIGFSETDFTDAGVALWTHAWKQWVEDPFGGSSSDVVQHVFDQVRHDPDRYLGPISDGAKSFTSKTSTYGSSFTASPDGYIVTARHVVTADDDVMASFVDEGAAEAVKDDAATWEYFLRSDHLSDSAKHSLTAALTAYQRRHVSVKIGSPKVSVFLPTATADGTPDADVVPADVVYRSGTSTGEDVAVLQVHVNGQMPALALAQTAAQQGDTIYLDAFPALPDRSLSAYLAPTVTQGQITAIKATDGGVEESQTNATASAGASGACALNGKGQVIGIEVAGAVGSEGSLGENYLMPLASIRDALNRAGARPRQGQTTTLYNKGLDDFQNNHYVRALGEFNQVKALYSAHAFVGNFISKAQLAISQGKNVPVVKPPAPKTVSWNLIVPAALGAFGLMVGAFIYFMLRRGKNTVGAKTAPEALTVDTTAMSPLSPVVEPYAGADPLAELLGGRTVDEPGAAPVTSSAEATDPAATDESEASEDGPDVIPEAWGPVDFVPGFPDSETRPNS